VHNPPSKGMSEMAVYTLSGVMKLIVEGEIENIVGIDGRFLNNLGAPGAVEAFFEDFPKVHGFFLCNDLVLVGFSE